MFYGEKANSSQQRKSYKAKPVRLNTEAKINYLKNIYIWNYIAIFNKEINLDMTLLFK